MNRRKFLQKAAALGAALVATGAAQKRLAHAEPLVNKPVYLPILNQGGVPPSPTKLTNLVFLHHSVGVGLIETGNMRGLLTTAGYSFWDQGYNEAGLRDPDGADPGYQYSIPNDNTHPDGLAAIFAQPYNPTPAAGTPANAFSGLMRHEVIIMKSCYLAIEQIYDPDTYEMYISSYLSLRDRIDQFPNKAFIFLTAPPVNSLSYAAGAAGNNGRGLANWMKSSAFVGSSHPNLFVYDFFDQLANPDDTSNTANLLKVIYQRRDGSNHLVDDSHPNDYADQVITPLIVNYIDQVLNTFTPG
jgi:hypothetical protein